MIESVILDLDHTLIYCPSQLNQMPRSSFHFKTHRTFFDGDLFLIYERPYLGEFIRSLRGKRLAVWTAASEEYAQFVVNQVIRPYLSPDQKIEFLWYSQHCDESIKLFGKLKHLDMLDVYKTPLNKTKTVIVDDNYNLLGQEPNFVYVIPQFSASIDDGDDVELLRALQFIGKV